MSQAYDQEFPNGYVWVRLKVKDPRRHKEDRIFLERLFALGRIFQGGDGIAVIPRWYKVEPAVAQTLLYFRQRQEDPNSPPAFDFVIDDETKSTIDMAETYNRHALMGLGAVSMLPYAQQPFTRMGLSPGAPRETVEEITRAARSQTHQPGAGFNAMQGALGQVYMAPGSEAYLQAAQMGGLPGGPHFPAPTMPQNPAAQPAPQMMPQQGYPTLPPAPQGPPAISGQVSQPFMANPYVVPPGVQLQQLVPQIQLQLQPAFAGRAQALRGIPTARPKGAEPATQEGAIVLAQAATVDASQPDALDVPGGDAHLGEADLAPQALPVAMSASAEVAELAERLGQVQEAAPQQAQATSQMPPQMPVLPPTDAARGR